MHKMKFLIFFYIFTTVLIFANTPKSNEVYVKGADIDMHEYVKFCDKTESINNLYVQKYEITRKEFEEYLNYYELNKLKEFSKDGGLYTYYNMMPYPDSAAVLVTFYDACRYCNWRSQKDGLTPVYEIMGELDFEIEYFQWKQEDNQWMQSVSKMPEIKFNKNANGYRLPTINEYFYWSLPQNLNHLKREFFYR